MMAHYRGVTHFYESQENHNLIGVANVFLECLFYEVKLYYHVPIISQQGEVAGKLHVEISKLGGDTLDRFADIHVEDSDEEGSTDAGCIHGAKGLPRELSHFVFCQYSFWGQVEPITVTPVINPDASSINPKKGTMSFRFDHKRDFKINVTDEFVEHCYDRALSIEVWGHRIVAFGSQVSNVESKTMSLTDRWSEVMRKIELQVEIQELNDQGEYAAVDVKPQPVVPCAEVFQLRQGHSQRIQVRVKPVAHSGTLPLICEAITSISVGSICGRFKLQKGLDSYQEEDLNLVRDRWSEALARRKNYLDEQIQKIQKLINKTEERNAVMVPAAGSGIPGAPADWGAPTDMERHMPVLFLDLNADDMSTSNAKEGLKVAGINSILIREQPSSFLSLPIIKTYTEKENVCAVVSWDSSVHDSNYLNRLTSSNECVYMILKAIVRLSHPASMELVLRKRLCINIYTKHTISSFTDKPKQRFIGTDVFKASGITYDVVSNIPKASEDLENMETLAQMAASSNEVNAADGETYIEKYIRGVSAVESILTLDRLRQEVAVKELMAIQGRNLTKTTSVPNINQVAASPGCHLVACPN